MNRDMYNETILSEAQAFQHANYELEEDDQEFDTDRNRPEYRTGEVDNDEGFEEGDSSRDLLGDTELDAQIDLVETLIRGGAPHTEIDATVDHLRGMLTIGYCDESDLPVPVQR